MLTLLLIYLVGMIPAIFMARHSVKLYYLRKLEHWDFWGWIVFPLTMGSFKIFDDQDNDHPVLKDLKIVGEGKEINLKQFCVYIMVTMIIWPFRAFWGILVLTILLVVGTVWLGIKKISPCLKRFAKI